MFSNGEIKKKKKKRTYKRRGKMHVIIVNCFLSDYLTLHCSGCELKRKRKPFSCRKKGEDQTYNQIKIAK